MAPTHTPLSTRFGIFGFVTVMIAGLSGCVVAPHPRHQPVYAPEGRVAAAPPPAAPPMYFYPERAQSEPQQERDRYECYRWASRETGTDPGMTPVRGPVMVERPLPPPTRDGAAVAGGAVTGAVLGAAVSSPRQAGANAVIGAVFGAVLGAAAQESRAQAIEQAQARRQVAAESAAQAAQVPMDNFRRAMSACMQGRGYRIG